MDEGGAITVALVNDYEVVVKGLNEMLAGDARFKVVELEVGGFPSVPVDIALYDTFGNEGDERLRTLGELDTVARVVVYSWDAGPGHVARALEAGAAGFVSKTLGATELRETLENVHAGEEVVATGRPEDEAASSHGARNGDWPGRDAGLTYREAEVVALISDALTNVEIAERLYLSINSVKTHIRSAYRKMDVERRSQAVRWAHANGLARGSHAPNGV